MKKKWTFGALSIALVILVFAGCGVVTDIVLDMRGTWDLTLNDFELPVDSQQFAASTPEATDLIFSMFISEQKGGIFKGVVMSHDFFVPKDVGMGADVTGTITGKAVEIVADLEPMESDAVVKLTGEIGFTGMSGTYEIKETASATEAITGTWTATRQK